MIFCGKKCSDYSVYAHLYCSSIYEKLIKKLVEFVFNPPMLEDLLKSYNPKLFLNSQEIDVFFVTGTEIPNPVTIPVSNLLVRFVSVIVVSGKKSDHLVEKVSLVRYPKYGPVFRKYLTFLPKVALNNIEVDK